MQDYHRRQYIAHVTARKDEYLESLLKRFKKAVDKEEILKEYKARQYYKKPSQARHEHDREVIHKRNKKSAKRSRKRH